MNGTVPDIQKAFNKMLVILNEEEIGYKISRMKSSGGEIAHPLQVRYQGRSLCLIWKRKDGAIACS